MKFLPKEHWCVATEKSKDAVIQSLRLQTKEKEHIPSFFFASDTQPFIGVINDAHFSVRF